MGFGNYGICDLWDFGIMGEGGRRGAKQREKGRARALVHQRGCCEHCEWLAFVVFFIRVVSKWGGGVWSETAWGGFLGGDDKQQGVFFVGVFSG